MKEPGVFCVSVDESGSGTSGVIVSPPGGIVELRDETLIIGGSHLKVVCVHPCFCFYDILICVLYTYELVFLTLNNSKLHYTNLEKSLKKARESFYFLIV